MRMFLKCNLLYATSNIPATRYGSITLNDNITFGIVIPKITPKVIVIGIIKLFTFCGTTMVILFKSVAKVVQNSDIGPFFIPLLPENSNNNAIFAIKLDH